MANVSKDVLDKLPVNIIVKALFKAMGNGWNFSLIWSAIDTNWEWAIYDGDESIKISAPNKQMWSGCNPYWIIDWNRIIFNHDFAKALWGDKPYDQYFGVSCKVTQPAYSFHLQEMVISDDPIQYLSENI